MKRILALVISLLMLFALTACEVDMSIKSDKSAETTESDLEKSEEAESDDGQTTGYTIYDYRGYVTAAGVYVNENLGLQFYPNEHWYVLSDEEANNMTIEESWYDYASFTDFYALDTTGALAIMVMIEDAYSFTEDYVNASEMARYFLNQYVEDCESVGTEYSHTEPKTEYICGKEFVSFQFTYPETNEILTDYYIRVGDVYYTVIMYQTEPYEDYHGYFYSIDDEIDVESLVPDNLTRGTINGSEYINKFAGFKFTCPDGWEYVSDEILNADYGADISDSAKFREALELLGMVYDVMAISDKSTFYVAYEVFSLPMTVDEYVAYSASALTEYYDGFTVSEPEKMMLGGLEFIKFTGAGNIYGTLTNQTFYVLEIDGVILTVALVCEGDTVDLAEFEACFSAYTNLSV